MEGDGISSNIKPNTTPLTPGVLPEGTRATFWQLNLSNDRTLTEAPSCSRKRRQLFRPPSSS